MIAQMLVKLDGSLMVGGAQVYGGCWYRCLMPDGWCDVLVERGPVPDVQESGSEGWCVSLPFRYRGRGVNGLLVQLPDRDLDRGRDDECGAGDGDEVEVEVSQDVLDCVYSRCERAAAAIGCSLLMAYVILFSRADMDGMELEIYNAMLVGLSKMLGKPPGSEDGFRVV